MPEDFESCVEKGGRVRTRKLDNKYIKFCFLDNKSYASEVKKRKLSEYQQCLGSQLRGRKFKNKQAVIEAFKQGVKVCKTNKAR